jgi:hypothetical protein
MPDGYIAADRAAWKRKLATYEDVRLEEEESIALSDREAWDLHERLGSAEERLHAQPAPDTEAVIAKLRIIWDEDELLSDIDYGNGKRTVIEDLRRLKACCSSPGQAEP